MHFRVYVDRNCSRAIHYFTITKYDYYLKISLISAMCVQTLNKRKKEDCKWKDELIFFCTVTVDIRINVLVYRDRKWKDKRMSVQ